MSADAFEKVGTSIARRAGVADLPTMIVGFGNATPYAVRLDEDDLQYLERWTLPYGTRLWGDRR